MFNSCDCAILILITALMFVLMKIHAVKEWMKGNLCTIAFELVLLEYIFNNHMYFGSSLTLLHTYACTM